MFSPEKSKRKESVERMKYISGAQLFLGIGLVVCAIIATSKHDDIETIDTPYFVGGYTCGIVGAIAGAFGVFTTYKASLHEDADVSVLRQTLHCNAITHMILGYVVFILAISGFMMNIIYLANSGEEKKIHVVLAACILTGMCVLILVTIVNLITTGVCCQCEEYNQRIMQTYPSTVGENNNFQGQTLFGQQGQTAFGQHNGGFTSTSNPNSYPLSHTSFGIRQQQATSFGIQQNNPTAPSPYSY